MILWFCNAAWDVLADPGCFPASINLLAGLSLPGPEGRRHGSSCCTSLPLQ